MKKQHFDGLLQSLDEARRFARGEPTPGLKVHTRVARLLAARKIDSK